MNQYEANEANEREMVNTIAHQARHSSTPAGLSRFSRVIVSKRDGTCLFCKAATRPLTNDYAAVNAAGKWVAVCGQCAHSLQAQVAGTVRSIEALADGHTFDDENPIAGVDMVHLADALQGLADEAVAYDVLVKLFAARNAVSKLVTPKDELVEALRLVAADTTATPRNREFAESLVGQFDRKGFLSDRQREAASRMVTRPTNVAQVENGLYLHNDGTIYKVYTTQNDRQATKVLRVVGGKGSFEYVKGGTRQVREAVGVGQARKLTQEEAAAFGRQHGFCVNCALDLTDDRSLAAGYGPVCARNQNWWYPTVAEAAEILNRPTAV